MILKYGSLFVCCGTAFSYGTWNFSNVTLSEDSTLKIEPCIKSAAGSSSKKFHLSPEWFIINPRPTAMPNCPPLPENKKQDGLFALTQPSEITIWFLTSSKYEKHIWIEKILPIITLNPPTPPEPPPPYSEYDNLSYFPWDTTANAGKVESKGQSSFTLPRPSIHSRSVFDPVEGDEEEYKKLHEEYKNLVDTMLASHMDDLGISPGDFEKACSESEKSIHSQFRKSLFEQLWAADDYEIFKRMMMQKNLELQLQALDLLAHQYGLFPESFLPSDDYEPSAEEKKIMETVMQRYIEENPEETDKEKQSEQKEVIEATKAQLVEEREREKKLMEQAIESSLRDTPKSDYEKPMEMTKMTEVSPEEAKRRQEYLKQQRDKLLALKKQEREKMLQQYERTNRPKSARAAQKLVTEESSDQTVDPKVLAFRKSLAAKLKAEVVDKKI